MNSDGEVGLESARKRAGFLDRLPAYVPAVITIILVVAFLLPLFRVPLISDDAILVHLPEGGRSVFGQIGEEVRGFLSTGRMAILSAAQFALVFNVFTSLAAYRFFQIALILLDLFLMFRLTKRLLGSSAHGYLAVLTLLGFLQTRRYHDAVTSFHGLVPTTTALLLGAALFTLRYSDGPKSFDGIDGTGDSHVAKVESLKSWRELALFGLCWTASMFYYEISLTLLPVWLVLGWRMGEPKRRAFLLTASLTTLAVVALNMVVRSVSTFKYEGTEPNLDAVAIGKTWFNQLSATVPFTYRVHGDDRVAFSGFSIDGRFLVVLLAGVLLGVFVLRGSLTTTKKRLFPAALIGLGLVFGPSAMISISKQYQNQLSPFVGYIPVYAQYFGATLLVVTFVGWISGLLEARGTSPSPSSSSSSSSRGAAQIVGIVLVTCAVLATLISADSFRQVATSLRPTATDRDLVKIASSYGVWKQIPAGSRIWMGRQSWAWSADSLVKAGLPKVTLITANTPRCARHPEFPECDLRTGDFAMTALADRDDHGLLVVGKAVDVKPGPITSVGGGTVFVRGKRLVEQVRAGRPVLFDANGTPVALAKAEFFDDANASFTFTATVSTTNLRSPGLEEHSSYT